jgi:signal transduction histidine kinase
VTVEVTAAALNVDIVNGPARSAPLELAGRGGTGLLGMSERVTARGGQLSAGPVPGGGRRVAASLRDQRLPGEEPPSVRADGLVLPNESDGV